MSNWIWDGGWRAHKTNPDGTVTALTFTSTALARQHVENENDQVLARHTAHHIPKSKHNRVSGRNQPITNLSEEQRRLKDQEMKRFAGLKKV